MLGFSFDCHSLDKVPSGDQQNGIQSLLKITNVALNQFWRSPT